MPHTNSKKRGAFLLPAVLIIAGLLVLFRQNISGLFSKANLEVKIEHVPAILPAAYKVYANEEALDGKYNLFKMLVTNTGKNTARNIDVSYEIPGYIPSTSVQKIPVLLPGQSAVVTCFPNFDPKIAEKTTPSKEKVNIKISGSNIDEDSQTFPIGIKGRNEMIYSFIPADEIRTPGEYYDNLTLAACFVTPEDPIIKYYTQQIQEKVLKGETASVFNKIEEGVRFISGIYEATRLSHTVYSGTGGVPSDKEGASSAIQNIRLPREVVTGKTGLCIELSILYASVMMNAGLNAVIFLVPGHAYPGFKMNGQYVAIESTGIGGEGLNSIMSVQEALQSGEKNLQEFIKGVQAGDDRYQILDVGEAIKNGALAMELKDDPFLRKKIDDIAMSFEGRGVPAQLAVNNTPAVNQGGNGGGGNAGGGNRGDGNGGGNTGGVPSGYRQYNGAVSFAYPGSWKSVPKSQYSMPQNVLTVTNNSMEAYTEVYQFQGISNPEQAMMMVQNHVANLGGQLQYKSAGQNGAFTLFQGQSYGGGSGIEWIAAFKPVNGGIAGVAVGTTIGRGSSYQNTIQNILNSIK